MNLDAIWYYFSLFMLKKFVCLFLKIFVQKEFFKTILNMFPSFLLFKKTNKQKSCSKKHSPLQSYAIYSTASENSAQCLLKDIALFWSPSLPVRGISGLTCLFVYELLQNELSKQNHWPLIGLYQNYRLPERIDPNVLSCLESFQLVSYLSPKI